MANLIIKSTANDLVIQGSDASPALTVAADGQTTFAEPATMSGTLGVTGNTTLSGTANNLGTVTAGTLSHGTTLQGYVDSSNTGVTFPAGHVIQTVGATDNSIRSITLCDSTALLGVAKTITSTVANSNFLIMGNISYNIIGGHSAIGIFKDGLDTQSANLLYTPSHHDSSGTGNSGFYGWYVRGADNSATSMLNPAICFYYDPGTHSVGTAFDLKIAAMGYAGHGPLKVNLDSTVDGTSSIIIQELAP